MKHLRWVLILACAFFLGLLAMRGAQAENVIEDRITVRAEGGLGDEAADAEAIRAFSGQIHGEARRERGRRYGNESLAR
jgi:hypothetical protein